MPDSVPDKPPDSLASDGDTSVGKGADTGGGPHTLHSPGGSLYPFLGPASSPDHLGTLGRYKVVAKLGEGGMGFVFRCFDSNLARYLAIKVMRPDFVTRPQALDRFLRERRSAAAVTHPNLVRIYDSGEHNGLPFLVMELLAGATLDDWLGANGGTARPDAAVRIAKDTLLGLAAVHKHGLVHRDIKPANLWVEEPSGAVKVLDFGLTRGTDDGVTAEGGVLGTPAYMSPEQADGKQVDARTDLFSVGTVLYRMLTGANPFSRGAALATLKAVASDEPMPLAKVAPWVPDHLAAFVHRLLSKNPEKRPADAQAALAELHAVEERLSGVRAESAATVAQSADTLPPRPEHLIGRDSLLASVVSQLRSGGVVILRGEGGMGKTALAAAVAHKVREAGTTGGAAWVNCERTPRFEECVRLASAALLGDRYESEAVESLAARVAAHLTSRGGLLVLDNFESVADDPAIVRWIAAFRSGAQVLLTTREVPPGLGGRVVPVHELARADAVALFRARAADAGLPAPPPAEIVDALCERVGDQPLAIELLAVRAARTPAQRLLERVRKSLAALDADTDPTRPSRHRGVRACFAESFAALAPTAREFLLSLSVLPASFGLELLSAVAGCDDWDEAAEELVASSLWRLSNERYAVHPLVRQLANEELGAGREQAERTAARRVAALAQAKRKDLRAAGNDRDRTKAYLNWCAAELPNLVAIADAAFARGDAAVVTALGDSLSAFWSARGYWDIAHRLYQNAIAAAVSASDHAAEAWCREYHGFICRHVGRFTEGEVAYRAALAICDQHPAADVHRGRILARFGKLLSVVGRYKEATELLHAALERFRRDDNADGWMMTSTYLGQVYKFAGDLPQAEELFLRTLERARRKNDAHRECESLFQLGNTYLRLDRFDDAERCLRDSLRLARLAEDRIRESQNLVDLGIAATRRGAWADAERFLNDGLQITRDLNLRLYEGRAMRRMAELWVARGDLARARAFAVAALAILESSEDRWAQNRARETLRAIDEALAGRSGR